MNPTRVARVRRSHEAAERPDPAKVAVIGSTPRPPVSVIIPCNDDSHLDAALGSLAAQDAPPQFEVIVVDDTDSGDLTERIAGWRDRLDLHVVRASKRGTPGGNRNVGVAESRGDLLLFVDADDRVGTRYVRAMAGALGERVLVCARIDLSLLNPSNLWGSHPQQKALITEDLKFLPFASAGTLGIHRSAFEEIGGFDPSLTRYGEADLCWRLQLAGRDTPTLVPEAVSHHRLGRRSMTRLRKAFSYGITEARLYSRYRGVGMPRESPAQSLAAWVRILSRLLRRAFGAEQPGVGWDLAIRVGRVTGSIRYGVRYL